MFRVSNQSMKELAKHHERGISSSVRGVLATTAAGCRTVEDDALWDQWWQEASKASARAGARNSRDMCLHAASSLHFGPEFASRTELTWLHEALSVNEKGAIDWQQIDEFEELVVEVLGAGIQAHSPVAKAAQATGEQRPEGQASGQQAAAFKKAVNSMPRASPGAVVPCPKSHELGFVVRDEESRKPLAGKRYRIEGPGVNVEGVTDVHGATTRVNTGEKQVELRLFLLDDEQPEPEMSHDTDQEC